MANAALHDQSFLPSVAAAVNYVAAERGPVQVRVFPPNSGRISERPIPDRRSVNIRDARWVADQLRLDVHGFELHTGAPVFSDFYDEAAVRDRYYPAVAAAMREVIGAKEVIVFDHNVRSAARAARGEIGVRTPVDQVHNDYTINSGPKRKAEILAQAGREDLSGHRVAFVNLWRPIVGPVLDNPLAVCSADTLGDDDLVECNIHHFGEGNLETPRHSGQIYSVRHNPAHRWYYVSEMQPHEYLLLKGYDSRQEDCARFMPHTGFVNPECPSAYTPRESIEARALVIYHEVN